MLVLGIETSCDECSAAVVEDGRKILSNVIATQIEIHKHYDGVVPEIASRLHTEWIFEVVKTALKQANITEKNLNAIAVTSRPGLIGSLLVGVNFAKGLSASLNIPFIGIDHIKAHLYAPQIEKPLSYPYLGVLLSGGHTVLCKVNNYDRFEILGTTVDDAIGEAFDKVAKFFHLGYPGGVMIDRLSVKGDSEAFNFPCKDSIKGYHPYDLSYSGLKTAVINQSDHFFCGKTKTVENIAASFQKAAVKKITNKIDKILKDTSLKRISAGGGVVANSLVRKKLSEYEKNGYEVSFPSLKLCTDNGAMVAGLGYCYLSDNITSDWSLSASARVSEFKNN